MRYALGTSLALLVWLFVHLAVHRFARTPWREAAFLAIAVGALTFGAFVTLPRFRELVRNAFFLLLVAYSFLAWAALYFLVEHLRKDWARIERALAATTIFLLASPVFLLLWHGLFYPIPPDRTLEIFLGGVIPPGVALALVPLTRHFIPDSRSWERVGLSLVAYVFLASLLVVFGGYPLASVVGWIAAPGLVAFLYA